MSSPSWIHFADAQGQVWVAALRGVDERVGEAELPVLAAPFRSRVVLRSGEVVTGVQLDFGPRQVVRVTLTRRVDVQEWAGARLEIEGISGAQ